MQQIGSKLGKQGVPEFRAETHEPGTAPPQHSYRPNPQSEVPGQALNPDVEPSSRTDALGSVPGATSASVYNDNEFGKPMQGLEQRELHGVHAGKRKKEHSGLEGVSASTREETIEGKVRGTGADLEGPAGEMKGKKGWSGSEEGGLQWSGAEEREPVRAEEVAAERY
jgi:hypothetical protein